MRNALLGDIGRDTTVPVPDDLWEAVAVLFENGTYETLQGAKHDEYYS